MTLLAASILADNFEALARQCRFAWAFGADAIEVRIDGYEGHADAVREFIADHADITWIITCRSAEEGGNFSGDTMDRVSRLIAFARGTNAYVDFEFADWIRSANIRQKVLLGASGSDGIARLILSQHRFNGPFEDGKEVVEEILRQTKHLAPRDHLVAKIAYAGHSILDSFQALDLIHQYGSRVIAICMGESGAWTRILAKKLGAFLSYAKVDDAGETAPGQITARQLTELYRWHEMDGGTAVYGVMGDPIGHSLSPRMHNRWFAQKQMNAVYLPLKISDNGGNIEEFLRRCVARPWFDVRGLSVTIPNKQKALAAVGENADALSRYVGAVNTLVVRDAEWRGHNTDSHASFDSMLSALGRSRPDVAGLSVDVLGSGGAARALLVQLRDFGVSVTVYARSREDAQALKDSLNFSVRPWEQRLARTGEVLINTTPIGMWPNTTESPMSVDGFNGCRLVFDFVYRPLQTRLLSDATAAGCATLSGLDMFVRQGAMQFAIWTGASPDRGDAMEDLTRLLTRSRESDIGTAGLNSSAAKSICLIGMRGAGKSVVGGELAAMLKVPHIDTDELVSADAGVSIAEIFRQEGERGFRIRESDAIRRAVQCGPGVVSLGGGAVLEPGNVQLLRKVGLVVWLAASTKLLFQRIASCPTTAHNRPPLTGLPQQEEIEQIAAKREPYFRRAADLKLDTTRLTALQIAETIVALLKRPQELA